MEATFIKNINPGYPLGIITIPTLQMRRLTIRRVKGLTQVSQPGDTARAGTQTQLPARGGAQALPPPPLHVPCTLLSLQKVGWLGFADGCWQGSVLAGDSCSGIGYLFLIHDLLPYVVPRYKQAATAPGFKAVPGAGTQPPWPGGQCSSVLRGEAEVGTDAGVSDQVAGHSAEIGRRERFAQGTEKGHVSEAVNLVPRSLAFET